MPPTPSRAPANWFRQPPDRSLRGVPAGYDLGPVPIHLPPRDGESSVSWLRRLSVRYDVAARSLLRSAGAIRPTESTSAAAARLRNNRDITAQLGLTTAEARALLQPHPMAAATKSYTDTLRGGRPLTYGSHYCPRCLAEPDPWWPDHWQTPLSLICPIHRCYLVGRCPGCGQTPHASKDWLARPGPLRHCPSRQPRRLSAGRRQRLWCDHDLASADTTAAPTEQVRAQELLHLWAAGSAEHASACGVPITHRIGFQALAQLIDIALGPNPPLTRRGMPTAIGQCLSDAIEVLEQPTLAAAARTAWMLVDYGPRLPGADIDSPANHYNPLLAAVQLAGIRGHASPTDELVYRMGHPTPRYPVVTSRENRRRLRLPEHHPHWSEPNITWIPQTLWRTTIPDSLLGGTVNPLRNSMLAMLMAKMSNPGGFSTICACLDLPDGHADEVGGFIRQLQLSGSWPTVLAALDELMTALQREPPTIDYTARRQIGGDIRLISTVVELGRDRHPCDTDTLTLQQQFWERFTGGDIVYAPIQLRLVTGSAELAAFRRRPTAVHADLLNAAHNELGTMMAIAGTLNWTPTRPPWPSPELIERPHAPLVSATR